MSLAPRSDRGDLLMRVGPPIAVLIGAMLLLPVGDIRPGREAVALAFGVTSSTAAVLNLAAGQALLLAGALAWLLGAPRRVGLIAVLAGVAWFGPDLWAMSQADPAIRAFGRFLLVPMLPVLLLHLAAAALDIDRRRGARVAIGGAYVASLVVAIAFAAAYDAFWDATPADPAFASPILVATGFGVPRLLRWTAAITHVGVGTVALGLAVSWARAAWRAPRSRLLVGAGLVGVGVGGILTGVLLIVSPLQDLDRSEWIVAAVVGILVALCLALGVAGLAFAGWQRVDRVRRMADPLEDAPPPGTLGEALARALGDPTLRIGYRLDDGSFVAGDGSPLVLATGESAGRTITRIDREGGTIAAISHASGVDADAIGVSLGPALLVALDNERLRAARLARLAELRASRARIVSVGDAERRRLERDLHDGVQQQLLTILFDLRLARLASQQGGDPGRATRLAAAEVRAQVVVDELRRIAHGIHPAVLSRSGLGPALASLAEEAPLSVEVAADGVGRLPEAVEAAAYQAVAEEVAEAPGQGATAVEVHARVAGGVLRVEVGRDGTAQHAVPVRIADRVGAAGGTATAEPLPTGGTLLRVELPCA